MAQVREIVGASEGTGWREKRPERWHRSERERGTERREKQSKIPDPEAVAGREGNPGH